MSDKALAVSAGDARPRARLRALPHFRINLLVGDFALARLLAADPLFELLNTPETASLASLPLRCLPSCRDKRRITIAPFVLEEPVLDLFALYIAAEIGVRGKRAHFLSNLLLVYTLTKMHFEARTPEESPLQSRGWNVFFAPHPCEDGSGEWDYRLVRLEWDTATDTWNVEATQLIGGELDAMLEVVAYGGQPELKRLTVPAGSRIFTSDLYPVEWIA